VSKAALEVFLLPGEEGDSASRSVPNTEEGFEQLFGWIDQQTEGSLEESSEQVHVCLEASGGYQRPVARFLHEQGLTARGRESEAYERLRQQPTHPLENRQGRRSASGPLLPPGRAKLLGASLFRATESEGHDPRSSEPQKGA